MAKEVESTAGGYSFPSAHSTSAGSVLTDIMIRYGKRTWVRIVCIAGMIIVPFSRMFLGCHTLEDVLFGLFLGIAMAICGRRILGWADRSRKNENCFLLLCTAVCVLMVLIVECKSYPMDYTADGSLLVDPESMKPDFFGACGMMMGWAVCRPLERNYVAFPMPASKKEAWIRGTVGMVFFLALFLGLRKLGAGWNPKTEQVIRYSLLVLFAGVLYPLSFRKMGTLIHKGDRPEGTTGEKP